MTATADMWEFAARAFEPVTHTWATPGQMAQHLDPPRWDPRTKKTIGTVQTPALDLIDDQLTQLVNQPDGRLIISMPPQEGKSTRVARDFIIWALTRNPNMRIVAASYAQGLANRNGRTVRNLIQAHPQLGIGIAADNGAVSEWSVAGADGGMLSVGRGAGVTGRPADMIVIDDPLKDRKEADSETIRDVCWDWWTDSLSTRLAPGAPVVLILTRWHEDDLAGRLLAAEDGHLWRIINIPAQAETDTDPLNRAPGEFMVSARGRTRTQWEAIRTRVGARTWASLYQGRPAPAEGGILRREWFTRRWDTLPDLTGATVVQSWDLTFKDSKNSDWVVGQVWAQIGATNYLLDQVRGRWGFTETCAEIRTLSAKWPQTVAKYVEDKANGPAVIDALRSTVPGLIPVNPEGGKEARAAAVSPLIEAGNVIVPARAPWVAGLVEECAGFPNSAHDDQVDALTQALTKLNITTAPKVSDRIYRIG